MGRDDGDGGSCVCATFMGNVAAWDAECSFESASALQIMGKTGSGVLNRQALSGGQGVLSLSLPSVVEWASTELSLYLMITLGGSLPSVAVAIKS